MPAHELPSAAERSPRDSAVLFAIWVLLALLVLISLVLWRSVLSMERDDQQRDLENELLTLERDIADRSSRYLALVRSGSAALSMMDGPSLAEWNHLVERVAIERDYPGVVTMAYIKRVPREALDSFLEHQSAVLGRPYGVLLDSGRDELCLITFVARVADFASLGYDVCTTSAPREVLEIAAASDDAAVSRRLQLVQGPVDTGEEPMGESGIVIAAPVRAVGRDGGVQKSNGPSGWLSLVVPVADLLPPRQDTGSSLTLVELGGAEGPVVLLEEPAGGAEAPADNLLAERTVSIGDRVWHLSMSRSFEPDMMPMMVFTSGILISFLFFFLLRNAWLTRSRAIRIAGRMTRALRDSEERRARSEEVALIMVAQIDPDGRWQKLTGRLCALLGRGESDLIGRPVRDFVHPADVEQVDTLLESLLIDEQRSATCEIRVLPASSVPVWIEMNLSLVRAEDQRALHFVAWLQDVSTRKRSEFELRRRDQLLEGVARSMNSLLEPGNFDDAVNRVLSDIGQAAGADRSYVFRNHPHRVSGRLAQSMTHEWTREGIEPFITAPGMQNLEYDLLPASWLEDLRRGLPVRAVARLLPDPSRSIMEGQGIKALLLVPIMRDGKFWGLIGFDDCHREREWPESELAVLLAAAGSIGAAFERQDTERALKESQQLLASVTDNITEGIYRGTLEQGLLYVNSALCNMFGYDRPQDMLTVSGTILYASPRRREELRALLEAQGSYTNEEVEYVRRDGSRFIGINNAVAIKDDKGNLVYFDGVISDITDRKEAENKIYYLAHYDTLTGLPNRTLLRDRMEQALAKARRTGRQMAVLFIDMDRFKNVNDSLGHAVGDRLLAEVARRLRSQVRADDTVSRQGGDEFIVLLTEIADAGQPASVAGKLLDALGRPYFIGNHELHVTPSIGISLYPGDAEDIEQLVRNADAAMYQAKERGRFNFQFFTHDLSVQAYERLSLEGQLRRAVEQGEFLLHYQPQVSLVTGEITGVEALLRWKHDKRLVSPSTFIPIAEQTGLIMDIGDWVLNEVCSQAVKWQEQGIRPVPVSVNISALQFHRRDIRSTIQRVLAVSGLEPRLLELELTESIVMQEVDESVRMLGQLSRLGVGICIDDFGTGYSSLSYLKRFPIDKLKIDKSFVSDIPQDQDDVAITGAVIDMAHNLNISVLAEGVETDAQLGFLRERRCDGMQGFLFSAAVSAEEIAEMLTSGLKLDLEDQGSPDQGQDGL
jgi:diguanylate cyclase (GGDEF)-like protein/PAS domain S-box-containing protein